ncbi:hypothetical protein WS67_03420 [Burkholderia singularis]|uniref:Uncharacterized protein n=1 Tax=Burkholderia singularis TaxID=1503053 RepID=A0A103E8P3_9BURK|nr:hypothetical protein WS67_03420 [Burkholderia singularis]
MRLIDEEQSHYVPPYSEDPEPVFLSEWLEASDCVQTLGHACVFMLAGALRVYFETWEQNAGMTACAAKDASPSNRTRTKPSMRLNMPAVW